MKIDILMDKNKNVMACFRKKKYTLTTSIDPVDGGTITAGGKFPINTVVPVEAIPNPDYEFDHWEGDVPSKWAGLCMDFGFYPAEDWDTYFDTLLANGFTEIRISMSDWYVMSDVDVTKETALVAIAKGFKVLWGISSANTKLTAENWATYANTVKECATWAQANGISEFLIGNELERFNDDTTLTNAQLRINIRTLATEVKAIFINGDVGYSNSCQFLNEWIAEGRGDIDQLSWMVYMDEANWKTNIVAMVAAFGSHTYINEFNLDSGGYTWWVNKYGADEALQVVAMKEMIDYFKASGITRAFFFEWGKSDFGTLKEDGTYRLLWNSLINSD